MVVRVLLILFLFFPLISHSASSPEVFVQGTLMGYDEETIKIKTSGSVVKVPRESINNLEGYVIGKAHVVVKVPVLSLLALNK